LINRAVPFGLTKDIELHIANGSTDGVPRLVAEATRVDVDVPRIRLNRQRPPPSHVRFVPAPRLSCTVRFPSALSDRGVFATSDKPRLVGVAVPAPTAVVLSHRI
jgi:hypothetical protein